MTIFEATMIAEGEFELAGLDVKADWFSLEEAKTEAWQLLHDTGVAYQLQGSFGRQAQRLIETGVIRA